MRLNGVSRPDSALLRHGDEEVHDLICVGFGPSNLAIAVALHDALSAEDSNLSTARPKVRFLERQPHFAWHAGMQVPGAKMQVSFLKDMATFRDPQSKFTFINYLHKNGRLAPFSNLGTFLPQRLEYEDYMRWCAKQFTNVVDYSQDVVAIHVDRLDPNTGEVQSFVVTATDRTTGTRMQLRTRNVVIGAGGKPYFPKHLQKPHAKIIHSSEYLTKLPKLFPKGSRPRRVAVVGGGQSAAEIFYDIPTRLPGAQSVLLVRDSALRPSDDSPFVNEVFNPEATDQFFARDATARAASILQDRATNYGVVRPELIEHIYSELYTYRLQYESPESWPHRIFFRRSVINISENDADEEPALTLQVHNASSLETSSKTAPMETLSVDLVVVACGYVRNTHETLMKDLRHLAPPVNGDEPKWNVGRDYAVKFREGVVHAGAGIYLQGCNEKSHGLSDSLLSVLAVRGTEVVNSIFTPGPRRNKQHRIEIITNGHDKYRKAEHKENGYGHISDSSDGDVKAVTP